MRRRANPSYPVGTETTVFEEIRRLKERCNLGHEHNVIQYATRVLSVKEANEVFIKALFYTEDGMGFEYVAYDQFGDRWECEDTWDGPSMWHSGEAKPGLARFGLNNPHLPALIDGEVKSSMRYSKDGDELSLEKKDWGIKLEVLITSDGSGDRVPINLDEWRLCY